MCLRHYCSEWHSHRSQCHTFKALHSHSVLCAAIIDPVVYGRWHCATITVPDIVHTAAVTLDQLLAVPLSYFIVQQLLFTMPAVSRSATDPQHVLIGEQYKWFKASPAPFAHPCDYQKLAPTTEPAIAPPALALYHVLVSDNWSWNLFLFY